MVAVLGIDPGANGAIALLAAFADSPVMPLVRDMPTMKLKRGGREVNQVDAPTFAALIRFMTVDAGVEVTGVYLEKVGAMPGQGVSSMFAFGRSVGVIEGVLAALELPCTSVTPQEWRRANRVNDGKDGSRARAVALFPSMSRQLSRKKDDGRAEALLIANYGMEMHRRKA